MLSQLKFYFPFSIYLLAQAGSAIDPNSVIQLVGNGITVVVLAWYVVYDVRTRTPAMLQAFKEEQEAARKNWDETIADVRALFAKEQESNRNTFATEQKESRAYFEREMASYRGMVLDMLQGMRTAVHDVRGTAQEAILKTAELAAKGEKP